MKNIAHKISHISVIYVLVFSLCAASLGALVAPQKASAFAGTGNSTDPYVITTCAELQTLDLLPGVNQGDIYSLGNDIDCSMTNPSDPDFDIHGPWADQQGFNPISGFENATFDGKGHTISGLYINRINGGEYVALFEYAPLLTTNLHIDSTSQFIGTSATGSIAAYLYYHSIEGVTSAATVTSSGGPVGGLVGQTYGDHQVIFRHDAFTGTVTNVGNNSELGGLIGRSYYGFDISDSYVSASINGGNATGGLIGNSGYGGSCGSRVLANSYATGTINTGGSGYAGGLFGQFDSPCDSQTKQIINTFSTVTKGTGTAVYGGMIGASSANVQVANSYFDKTNIGTTNCIQSSSASPDISTCYAVNTDGTEGDLFKNVSNIAPFTSNWDFDNTWQTASGQLPTLRAFSPHTGPSAVEDLVLTPQSNAKIDVTYNDASWGTMGSGTYELQAKRSTDSWDGNLITSVGLGTSTSYTIDTYLPATNIDVRVLAISRYGRGPWTEVSATTLTANVHQISTCAELQAIDDVSGEGTLDTYTLTQDIDCSDVDFQPIGSDGDGWDDDSFRGTFDGQGHTISNLTINQPGSWNVGLFYQLRGATIRDLSLVDGSMTGYGQVGSFAGYADDGASISNVSSNININSDYSYAGGIIGYTGADEDGSLSLDQVSYNGNIEGDGYLGGLIGYSETYEIKTTTISRSSATGSIVATSTGPVGGLVGYSDVESDSSPDPTTLHISNSYSHMDITADGYAGGLIGEAYFYNGGEDAQVLVQIDSSYASGNVDSADYASGLIGYVGELNDEQEDIVINDSFAAVTGIDNGPNFALVGGDGFVNNGSLTFTNSYFDQDLAGLSDAAYDFTTGTTAISGSADYFKGNKTNQPFDSWDFVSTWKIKEANYPVFKPLSEQDLDSDGIPNDIENAGPNNGDANGDLYDDGIMITGLDSAQPNVSSLPSSVSGKYAVLQTSCQANQSVSISPESTSSADSGYNYSAGLISFTATGCGSTATITQYFYGDLDASKVTARKFNPITKAYTTIPGSVITNVTVGSQKALKIVYQIADNGPLDEDPTAGTITDPSGPASLTVSVPNTGLGKP